MEKSEFENSPSGRLVPTERSQWAYVPNPLPPVPLELQSLFAKVADVSQALGELNGIARTLRDPYLLIRPLQAREALTSSSMEGTHSTVDELMIAEASDGAQGGTSDTREVWNYRRALSEAIEGMDKIPLSLRTLREAHSTLLSGVLRHRGARVEPGEFKRHQNYIGAYEIENARFIPPPPRETLECLDALEKYIHRENAQDIPALIDAALIHYQFETIHPFADGNGRVGRMLITLHLYMRRAVNLPILYLSPVFERRKDEYIDRMFDVSRSGAWLGWIEFFLDVVLQSCQSTVTTADKLFELERSYRQKVQETGRSANLAKIVDQLFRQPVQTIPSLAQHLGVSYRAAQLNVEHLVKAGVLSEIAKTNNPKFFAARQILDIIAETNTPHARPPL